MSSAAASTNRGESVLRRLARWAPIVGFGLAALALLLLALGPLGWRAGWWHFRFAFFWLMPWSAYVGAAAAVVAAATLVGGWTALSGRGVLLSAVSLAIGATLVWVPWHYNSMRGVLPPIHDITTDVADPPELVAVLPARQAENANPVAYEGGKVAELQEKAYPGIAPLTLSLPPQEAFRRALDVAKARGLTIDAADPAAGRIEASESSRWFGFTDDCAIRVAGADPGSRVDMRCVSRQGRSDFGVNARRIESYLAALRQTAG